MTDEKGRLLEEGFKKPTVSENSSPSTTRMGRFAFILFLTGLLTFFTNARSQEPPSIEERVDKVLSETPLIGRKHVPTWCLPGSANGTDRWPRRFSYARSHEIQ